MQKRFVIVAILCTFFPLVALPGLDQVEIEREARRLTRIEQRVRGVRVVAVVAGCGALAYGVYFLINHYVGERLSDKEEQAQFYQKLYEQVRTTKEAQKMLTASGGGWGARIRSVIHYGVVEGIASCTSSLAFLALRHGMGWYQRLCKELEGRLDQLKDCAMHSDKVCAETCAELKKQGAHEATSIALVRGLYTHLFGQLCGYVRYKQQRARAHAQPSLAHQYQLFEERALALFTRIAVCFDRITDASLSASDHAKLDALCIELASLGTQTSVLFDCIATIDR